MISHIGFGIPNTQDFARFRILADSRSGVYSGWDPQLQYVEDGIVGSDDFEIQIMGFGSAQLTLQIDFDTPEDYFQLQAMRGRKRPLRLWAGFTRHKGTEEHRHGLDYETYDNTLLVSLIPIHRVGEISATATFIRSVSGMGVSSL